MVIPVKRVAPPGDGKRVSLASWHQQLAPTRAPTTRRAPICRPTPPLRQSARLDGSRCARSSREYAGGLADHRSCRSRSSGRPLVRSQVRILADVRKAGSQVRILSGAYSREMAPEVAPGVFSSPATSWAARAVIGPVTSWGCGDAFPSLDAWRNFCRTGKDPRNGRAGFPGTDFTEW